MSSSRKKAIFRKFSRDWVAGYLPVSGFVRDGQVEMLDLDGKVLAWPPPTSSGSATSGISILAS